MLQDENNVYFLDRLIQTHLNTPYSYVTQYKDIVLCGSVKVCLIGCKGEFSFT